MIADETHISSSQQNSGGVGRARSGVWEIVAWAGIIIGAFLRFFRISHKSLWFDEGYTAWMCGHSVREIIRLIRADTAPPLFYLLLHGWTLLFGHSEAGLRSLSAVLSIGILLGAWAIGRRLLKTPAQAALVVWLLVLGFQQEFYAQEARAYALMAFLAVSIFYLLLRYLEAGKRVWLVPIGIGLAASLYTHNMMAPYALGLIFPWMLLPSAVPMRKRIMDGLLAGGLAILLYLPWALTSLRSQLAMVQGSFWVARPSLLEVLTIVNFVAGIPRYDDWNHFLYTLHSPRAMGLFPAWVGLGIIVFCVFFSMWRQDRDQKRRAMAIFAYVLFPPIVVTVYSLISRPILMDKIFLASAALMPIGLVMPLGVAMSSRARWIARGACVGMLLICGATLANYEFAQIKEQWRDAAQYAATLPAGHNLIIFLANDGELPFDYYYHYRPGEEATGVPGGFFENDPPQTMLRVSSAEDVKALEGKIDSGHFDHVTLVLAHWNWGDPAGYAVRMLQRHFRYEKHRRFYLVSVYTYE